MKIYRPNRFIWAVTFLFLIACTVLAALVVLRSAGSDLLGASLLLVICLFSALAVGNWGSTRIELTPTYVAQQGGWRPWRLDWNNFDKIAISEDPEGSSIELIDLQGKSYTPLALLFATHKDKEAFVAAVREHASRTPNRMPVPASRR
jgi:hypothetical protein